MHVVFAYVWMAPSIVSYMVHLLAYAPGRCSRLFTLSCMCSWIHHLNCTLDIGCDIWFVFYREVFWLFTDRLGFWDQTNYSGKLPSVTGEIVIKLSVIGYDLWYKVSCDQESPCDIRSSQVEACFNIRTLIAGFNKIVWAKDRNIFKDALNPTFHSHTVNCCTLNHTTEFSTCHSLMFGAKWPSRTQFPWPPWQLASSGARNP